MTRTDAAKLLRESNPTMNIIFVTSYSSYMKDALDIHASGYITKPVSPEKVRSELSCLRFPVTDAQGDAHCASRLSVHCFGNFEVFVDGNPLACTSSRSIELFAYLIDRQGALCSVGKIEAALWGNRPRTPSRQSHLRNLLADLSRSLKETGCEGVLVRQYGYIGLDASLISCDYWDYLANKPGTANLFRGEYMSQYSWAETTLGRLINFG